MTYIGSLNVKPGQSKPDRYVVECYGTRSREWHIVMTVESGTIAGARRELEANGYRHMTTTRLWRIVDREGTVVRRFFPKGF